MIPHEVLWRVPFEALPTENGYLADTTTVVYAGSVTALVRTPPIDWPADSPVQLVAAASPQLAPTVVDELARSAPGWAIRGEAGGQKEMAAILAGVDADRVQALTAAEASEAALGERLPHADIIHLARAVSRQWCKPAVLDDAARAGSRQRRHARSPRDHESRSACPRELSLSDGAAMAMRDAADEVGAVGWAWRAAGVPALVLPRWSADDLASTAFMVALHERLRAGDVPDVALQTARARMRSHARDVGAVLLGQLDAHRRTVASRSSGP